MDFIIGFIIFIIIIATIVALARAARPPQTRPYDYQSNQVASRAKNSYIPIIGPLPTEPMFSYTKKDAIMTSSEIGFYRRLLAVAGERYYVFPQIHLSALMTSRTQGRYGKLSFQRINRMSVDYVLCDKQTLRAVYAVELDDSTHDTAKRRARDAGVEQTLASVGLPLVRFRDVYHITDSEIAEKFQAAAR